MFSWFSLFLLSGPLSSNCPQMPLYPTLFSSVHRFLTVSTKFMATTISNPDGSLHCMLTKMLCKAPNLCIRLYTSAWVSKSPHILYVQNQTHRVKTHTTSYNLFLVNGITVNPETCLLPYFLPIMWVWSVNPEASLPSF